MNDYGPFFIYFEVYNHLTNNIELKTGIVNWSWEKNHTKSYMTIWAKLKRIGYLSQKFKF